MCLSAFHGPHCNYLKQRAYNDQMIWNHMKTFTAEPRTKQIKKNEVFIWINGKPNRKTRGKNEVSEQRNEHY